MKWIGVGAAILLVVSCFAPWYYLEWKEQYISGLLIDNRFGKPAYWHFVFVFLFLIFTLINRIWAKQWNVFIAAINCAWMIRNFFVLAVCSGGNCPERQYGIWLVLIASIMMLLSALFPDLPVLKNDKPGSDD